MTGSSSVSITIFLGNDTVTKNHVIQNLEPMLFPFDPYTEVIHFDYIQKMTRVPVQRFSDKVNDRLLSPAIAVMLFAPERGPVNAEQLKSELMKPPWSLHHTVILQKKSVSMRTVAQQNFYELLPELPLWSVCPTLLDEEYLRIHIVVHDFDKMVEFYKLLTGVEMQSKKPGFCFFQLRSPSGQKVQLSLKRCPSIETYLVPNALISFKINGISRLMSTYKTRPIKTSRNVYTLRDPDGNKLCVVDQLEETCCSSVYVNVPLNNVGDKSHSDSQDSGLFSDYDQLTKYDHKVFREEKTVCELINQDDFLNKNFQCTEETDFEDPWDGSQYNVSVNPSQTYKVIPKTYKSNQKSKEKLRNDNDIISEITNYVTMCKNSGFSDSEPPGQTDRIQNNLHTYYQLECEQNMSKATSRENTCSASSVKYQILPDEGYNDTFNRNTSRCKSLDLATLKSFRRHKNRSVIQIISDKLLSREKKLHSISLNSIIFKNDQLNAQDAISDNISEDIWFQNPKLFQVLGPPEPSIPRCPRKANIEDNSNPRRRIDGYLSDGCDVQKYKQNQGLVRGRRFGRFDEMEILRRNQIGTLVCPSS